MAKRSKDEETVKPGSAAELAQLYPGRIVIPVKVYKSEDSDEQEDDEVIISEMPIARLGRAWAPIRHLADVIKPESPFLALSVEYPEIRAMIGVAIRWEPERVGMLAPGSLGLVFAAVLEANPGFFGLLPAFRVFVPSVTPETSANGAGETRSATSDATATAIQNATH